MDNGSQNFSDYTYDNYTNPYNNPSYGQQSSYDAWSDTRSNNYSNRHSAYVDNRQMARGRRGTQQKQGSGIAKKVLIGCGVAVVVVIALYLIYVFLARMVFAGAVISAFGGA